MARSAAALGLMLSVSQGALASDAGAPPGRMVDVGTHRLHIHCQGEGSPTVVLDAGLGASSLHWQPVLDELAPRTRVCSYDRAGMGWSETGPRPRTVSRIADELFLLLVNAEERPPFVLVGHSFGGYTVQLFASRYAYLVAGVVLVDASHAGQVERFLAPPLHMNTAPRRIPGAVQRVEYGTPRLPESMPVALREQAMALMLQPKARRAMTEEYLYFRDSAAEVREAAPFPAVPLVVLSRGRQAAPADERGALVEQLWLQLQSELSHLSPVSAHILADLSAHQIPLDQPHLVADAVSMVADFGASTLAEGRPMMVSTAGRHPPRWLAFEDATWLSDRLRSGLGLERPLPAPLAGQGMAMRIGHFSGTALPAEQQVVYFRGRDEACGMLLPGTGC